MSNLMLFRQADAVVGPWVPFKMPLRRFSNHSSHTGVHTPVDNPLSSNLLAVGHHDSSAGVDESSEHDGNQYQVVPAIVEEHTRFYAI